MSVLGEARTDAEPKLVDPIDGTFLLLAGFSGDPLDPWIYQAAEQMGRTRPTIEHKNSLAEVDAFLSVWQVGALALGPALDPAAVVEFLVHLDQGGFFLQPELILVGRYEPTALLSLMQEDRLYYFVPESLSRAETAKILVAGWTHFRDHFVLDLAALGRSQDPRVLVQRTLLTAGETLLQKADLESMEEPALMALDELIGIESGRLWVYDSFRHVLSAASAAEQEASAVAGITSFVARTTCPVRVEHAEDDARYDFEADGGGERLLSIPVLGPERRVLGVLALRRPSSDPPFTPEEESLAERFAQHLAPQLTRCIPQQLEGVQERLGQSLEGAKIFRPEALEANARGFSETGRILKNLPGWTQWTWAVLLAGFFTALLFTLVGTMNEYAGGPAVVRVGQRIDVASQVAASVIDVDVEPGARVEAGTPLVRLYGAVEALEIANMEQEFEQRLRQRLAAPGDSDVETALINARTNLDRARARLAERIIRAPSRGVVGDVRIRPGQHLAAGEFLLSVIADGEMRSVVGFVPGHFGPQISVGRPLRLTLSGYPDLTFDLEVTSVGEEVIGLKEARQSLGDGIADTVDLDGPLVLVEGRLPEATFQDGRQSWVFRDGMQGQMEVRVRKRPILLHLVPGLERAFRRWSD